MADAPTTPTAPTTSATPPADSATNPNPAPPTAAEPPEEKVTLTTAQLNARLERERQTITARFEKQQADDKAKAEQERAKAQGEWQKLAEAHAAKVAELEPERDGLKTRYESLAERINKQIDTAIKEWPLEARKMLPAGDDVAARQDAYDNLRALLDKGALAGPRPGTPTRQPRPTDPNSGPDIEAELRASPRYQAI